MVFEQHEIEEAVLNHFSAIFQGQRVPVYMEQDTPSQVDLAMQEIDQILSRDIPEVREDKFEDKVCSPFTFVELEQALHTLPSNKASGFDNISNEMLKHSSLTFRLYLQTFLNRIIEEGEVPPDLNIGKCLLVYKVTLRIIKTSYQGLFSRLVTPVYPLITGLSQFQAIFCVS